LTVVGAVSDTTVPTIEPPEPVETIRPAEPLDTIRTAEPSDTIEMVESPQPLELEGLATTACASEPGTEEEKGKQGQGRRQASGTATMGEAKGRADGKVGSEGKQSAIDKDVLKGEETQNARREEDGTVAGPSERLESKREPPEKTILVPDDATNRTMEPDTTVKMVEPIVETNKKAAAPDDAIKKPDKTVKMAEPVADTINSTAGRAETMKMAPAPVDAAKKTEPVADTIKRTVGPVETRKVAAPDDPAKTTTGPDDLIEMARSVDTFMKTGSEATMTKMSTGPVDTIKPTGFKSSSSTTGGAVAAGPFTFEDDNIKYGSPDSSPRAMRRTGEGATPVSNKVMEVRS
jgi:hypothetical protein